MTTLSFDLLADRIELCLLKNGEPICAEKKTEGRNSELLLEAIDSFLRKNGLSIRDLDLIVCNKGPGSFTALRVTMATAKGLAQGADLPVVSVCGLDGYAALSEESAEILLPVVDGRKNRFYAALYENGKRVSDYRDEPTETILESLSPDRRYRLCGEDAAVFAEKAGALPLHITMTARNGERPLIVEWTRLGEAAFRSGRRDTPSEGPFYLRKSQAEEGNG